MQTGSKQLEAQQRIMQAKNFYNGKVDGIWGPKSIKAMQKWERSGKFAPAVPNNGFPLSERGPFPAGVKRKPDGLLTCMEVEAKQAAAPTQASKLVIEAEAPAAEVVAEKPTQPQQNQQHQHQNRPQNQQNQHQKR